MMNLYIRRLFMKCRIIKNKRILAGIVILGILLIGGVVISQAAEDEYRVHHNITIDLDGGVCDGIYYQSQIDHGPNQGQWRDDLGTGLYLSDRIIRYWITMHPYRKRMLQLLIIMIVLVSLHM